MTDTTTETVDAPDAMELEITDAAVSSLKKALEGADANLDEVGLRVLVQPGGCSGFSYGLEFDDENRDNDLVIEKKGVRVVVDRNTVPLLNGMTIDFVDSLMGGGFKIENPNASSTCGCGKSFS